MKPRWFRNVEDKVRKEQQRRHLEQEQAGSVPNVVGAFGGARGCGKSSALKAQLGSLKPGTVVKQQSTSASGWTQTLPTSSYWGEDGMEPVDKMTGIVDDVIKRLKRGEY